MKGFRLHHHPPSLDFSWRNVRKPAQEPPIALQKRLAQGQTCNPGRDRLSMPERRIIVVDHCAEKSSSFGQPGRLPGLREGRVDRRFETGSDGESANRECGIEREHPLRLGLGVVLAAKPH
jgi:hypothetical protein